MDELEDKIHSGLYFTVLSKKNGDQHVAVRGMGLDMTFEATARFAATGASWGGVEYAEASVCYNASGEIFEIARFKRGSSKPIFDCRKEWEEELNGLS